MLIQILLALFVGILAGTFTGLIPGIHINLLGVFLVSLSATLLSPISSTYIIVFIVAMAITHTFLDFIPSIFLGCPDTDTELSILPGHELLKQGHGYQAILLTAYGSLAAIIILLAITIPCIILIEKLNPIIQEILPYLLIGISLLLLSLEKRKILASFIFAISGLLGYFVLNLPSLNQPLLPLLTGLFGGSTLVMSIKNKTKIPEQKIERPKPKLFRPLIGAIITSPLCSFLPGLGSGQAAVIGNTLVNRQKDKKTFLILLGATNTLVMGFSFIALYAISRTRTGAALAIKEIIGTPSTKILILILIVAAITGVFSFFLTTKIAKIFSTKINSLNYTTLTIITLIILISVVFLISGLLGILILIVSTLTGIYAISFPIKRTNMMGCLLIPTIIFYLTI